jgi:hypothetical protein
MERAVTFLAGAVQKSDIPSKLERYLGPIRGINLNVVCIHVLKDQRGLRFGDCGASNFVTDFKREGRLVHVWDHIQPLPQFAIPNRRKKPEVFDIRRNIPCVVNHEVDRYAPIDIGRLHPEPPNYEFGAVRSVELRLLNAQLRLQNLVMVSHDVPLPARIVISVFTGSLRYLGLGLHNRFLASIRAPLKKCDYQQSSVEDNAPYDPLARRVFICAGLLITGTLIEKKFRIAGACIFILGLCLWFVTGFQWSWGWPI